LTFFILIGKLTRKGGESKVTLGDFIKKYRLENNLTQDDFARIANISRGYVSQLESGINPKTGKPAEPGLVTLNSIAAAMRMTIDEVLAEVDSFNISLSSDIPDTRVDEIGRITAQLNDANKHALLVFARALEQEQRR
jgi:transcriptional regulator with XRE-family HTH domain